MTTQTAGRVTATMVAAVALLATIVAVVPAPVQVVAALISLPVAALIFSGGASRA